MNIAEAYRIGSRIKNDCIKVIPSLYTDDDEFVKKKVWHLFHGPVMGV